MANQPPERGGIGGPATADDVDRDAGSRQRVADRSAMAQGETCTSNSSCGSPRARRESCCAVPVRSSVSMMWRIRCFMLVTPILPGFW